METVLGRVTISQVSESEEDLSAGTPDLRDPLFVLGWLGKQATRRGTEYLCLVGCLVCGGFYAGLDGGFHDAAGGEEMNEAATKSC